MPFPFGKSQKSPAEIVKTLRENVAYMEKLDAGDSKKCEKVSNGCFLLSHIWKLALVLNMDWWSKSLTVFTHQGCRGGVQKSSFTERDTEWNRWQGASNRSSGSACTGAVQHRPPHHSHRKPAEDWFWGGIKHTHFHNYFTCVKSIDHFAQRANWQWGCVCVWLENLCPKQKHLCISSAPSQPFICLSTSLFFLFFKFLQGKKDVVHLFSNIVRRQIGTRAPTVEYICSHSEILFMLLKGWVHHSRL